jgi:hypothetical protein
MKTFAVISGNIVSNVIAAEDESVGEVLGITLVEYTPENPACIGWTYDEATRQFSPPIQQEEVENS